MFKCSFDNHYICYLNYVKIKQCVNKESKEKPNKTENPIKSNKIPKKMSLVD